MMTSDTKTFDGVSFTTTQFPAMRAFRLFGRLMKILGPAIGEIKGELKGIDANTPLNKVRLEEVLPTIGDALGALDPDAGTQLAQDLFACTFAVPAGSAERTELTSGGAIDLIFSGRVRVMLDVLMWIVKVNYGDFLRGAAAPATPASA